MKPLPLLLLLLTALPTFARLGETKAECETRYGKPVGTTAQGNPAYLKGGLDIVILFWKDKAITLFIGKHKPGASDLDAPGDDAETRDPLTLVEIDVLLKANSATLEWKKEEDNPFAEHSWTRADKRFYAAYGNKTLEIRNNEANNQRYEEQDREAAQNLKDFSGLGETKAQCEKRYGKSTKTILDSDIHNKAGLQISIVYWKDKAAKISFSKVKAADSPIEPDQTVPLSETERDTLLKANSGTSKWQAPSESSNDILRWERADEKALALYDQQFDKLTIFDTAYVDHQFDEKEKKAAEKLDGF